MKLQLYLNYTRTAVFRKNLDMNFDCQLRDDYMFDSWMYFVHNY
jgi:hypothetical protein